MKLVFLPPVYNTGPWHLTFVLYSFMTWHCIDNNYMNYASTLNLLYKCELKYGDTCDEITWTFLIFIKIETTMKEMSIIYFFHIRLFPSNWLVSVCVLAGILNCAWVGWHFKLCDILLLLLAKWYSKDDAKIPFTDKAAIWLTVNVTE